MLTAVAALALGLRDEQVRLVAGDTDLTPFSPVSAVGSRGAAIVGSAVRAACAPLRDKLRRQAAYRLGCAPDAVELADGEARAATRSVLLGQLARELLAGHDLAGGVEPGLDSIATVDPEAAAMTYGVHAAIVELDPALGTVFVRRYLALDDCGPRLQPSVVEGQLLGGIAQGIGAALLEELRFDADGQPLTAGLETYLLPVADTIPPIELRGRETPSPRLPGGVKGIGEAGVFGPPAAIAQAVDDALGRPTGAVTRLPLTLERVLALSEEVAVR